MKSINERPIVFQAVDQHFTVNGIQSDKWIVVPYVSSTEVIKNKEGQLLMKGNLTLLEQTKEVLIPFEIIHGEKPDAWKNFRISLKGMFSIDRTEYGMDYEIAILHVLINQ